jgi:hypothetical protein
LLGGRWTAVFVSSANATDALVPGATAFAFAGIGPRSAGAGEALDVTIGAVIAIGSLTPLGTEVVRFGSGLLQPASASVTPASTNAVDGFMRTP